MSFLSAKDILIRVVLGEYLVWGTLDIKKREELSKLIEKLKGSNFIDLSDEQDAEFKKLKKQLELPEYYWPKGRLENFVEQTLKSFFGAFRDRNHREWINNSELIKEIKKFTELPDLIDLKEKHKDAVVEEIKKLKNRKQREQLQKKHGILPIFVHGFTLTSGTFQSANCNLRIGESYYLSTNPRPQRFSNKHDIAIMTPGEFAILTTYEYIYIPWDLIGLISVRFGYKNRGLVNISGFHVDPGFHGKLLFSLYNAGPKNIILKYKEPVFMIMFEEIKSEIYRGYEGPLVGQEDIPMDMLKTIAGPSVSLKSLEKKISLLEIKYRVLEGIMIAIAGGLFILIIKALVK
ncbi:hypothetical protein KAW65_00200 [candidate division WOR-3 bacterium]|nr:hypothetical protein [candidate division WOR-3 bacterium]